jgi:hypothetical protein
MKYESDTALSFNISSLLELRFQKKETNNKSVNKQTIYIYKWWEMDKEMTKSRTKKI